MVPLNIANKVGNSQKTVTLKTFCSYRGKKGVFMSIAILKRLETTVVANGQKDIVPTCSYRGKKGAFPDTRRQARKIAKWPTGAKPL
jgi:hypothetical protein